MARYELPRSADTSSENLTEAQRQLMAARRLRMVGDATMTVERAAAAHLLAEQEGDGETVWQARTCVGRLYYWRGEFSEAYAQYFEALKVAEVYGLPERVLGSHHDCYMSLGRAGLNAREHVVPRMTDGCKRTDGRLWALIHEIYALRMDSQLSQDEQTIRASYLRIAALGAHWYIKANPEDWYADYQSRFERMIVCSSLVESVGVMVAGDKLGNDFLDRAAYLFDAAAEDLGARGVGHCDEGYALCALDASKGLTAAGRTGDARLLIRRAMQVAERRNETVLVEMGREMERNIQGG